MADDSEEGEEERNPVLDLWPDFEPMANMPTSRLNDVLSNFETKSTAVLSLDACLPTGEACAPVLQTVLFRMPATVTTLSLRFNNLSTAAVSLLADWIAINTTLETMYVMSAGVDDKQRAALESAWGKAKNMCSQRTENFGNTFLRCPVPETEGGGEDDD